MKKIILTILILIAPNCPARAQSTIHDNGSGWQQVDIGATQALFSICFINSQTGWIAGGDGLFMTNDSGNTWQQAEEPGFFVKVQFLNEQVGWLMTGYGAIMLTVDGGKIWHNTRPGDGQTDFYFLNADTGIVCGVNGVSLTTDGANSWRKAPCRTVEGDSIGVLNHIIPIDGTHLMIVGCGGPTYTGENLTTIIYSSDAGFTWSDMSTSCAKGTNLEAGVVTGYSRIIAAGDRLIGSSVDSGQTWLFAEGPDIGVLGGCRSTNGIYLAGATNSISHSAIIVSTDEGQHWITQICPNVGALTDIQFSDPNTGWAVSGSGDILRTTNAGYAGVALQKPSQSNAVDVFPNPSRGQVELHYELNKAEAVTLRLYDMTGNIVETLLDKELRSAGEHRLTIREDNLPAGTYVYHLDTERDHAIGKLILVR
jgi:photosystem II stability/assembly factor-like uncharacterized protein